MTAIDHEVLSDAARWRGLLLGGAWAALASVALIVVQVGIYFAWPPPETTTELFELLLNNPILGAISLDAIYIVSNLLVYLLYFALAVALWRVSPSAVVVALAIGVLGMAAYMASPRPVEMLSLAWAYSGADAAERVALVATGDGMIATWKGTAFDVYYFSNLVTLLILSLLMFSQHRVHPADGDLGCDRGRPHGSPVELRRRGCGVLPAFTYSLGRVRCLGGTPVASSCGDARRSR